MGAFSWQNHSGFADLPPEDSKRLADNKKSTAEMVSKSLREAGTLLLVFAPLYVAFEGRKATWLTLCLLIFVGIAFLYLGIQVERNRR